MQIQPPVTNEELYLAFRRIGYRRVIELYGLSALLQHHTIDDIVWTAWHADEVGERTIYYRKSQLRALICSVS